MSQPVILILGASGGLGRALTTHFLKDNFSLALQFNSTDIDIEENDRLKSYKADLRNEEEVIGLISSVSHDFGRIDGVINAAGISLNGMSWKTSLENWQETLDVNLTAPFLVTKHVLPIMREQNFGRIIYISSIVAQTGVVGASAYAASKAGLSGLAKTVSKEVSNKNITSNAIALGYFNAGMINDVPETMKEEIINDIPLKRLGDPKELYKLISFLLSAESSYFTGQTIALNGGLYS